MRLKTKRQIAATSRDSLLAYCADLARVHRIEQDMTTPDLRQLAMYLNAEDRRERKRRRPRPKP